jgi:hypothetical protein
VQPTVLEPGLAFVITRGGTSVQIVDITKTIGGSEVPMNELGGVIINPLRAIDQGITTVESLYVNLLGPASISQSGGNTEIIPGQWFLVPANTNAWVNARTNNHKFTSYFRSTFRPPHPSLPVPGQPGTNLPALGAEPGAPPYPPRSVTGLTTVIPSYLYQEYTDDDDLQGWVEAQNIMQQDYVDTFNALNLPIYTGPIVSGALLDWVGRGVYGFQRPVIGPEIQSTFGPLNTYGPNWLVPMWDEFAPATRNRGTWQVAVNTPDLNNLGPSHGDYWTAVTASPNVPETAPSSIPGIGGFLIYDGDKILYDAGRKTYGQTDLSGVEAVFGLNVYEHYDFENLVLTNDDVYRRILSWHFFKQDGNYFSTEFLKRRVWRFLYGKDGKDYDYIDMTLGAPHPTPQWPGSVAELTDKFIADRRQISVTMGANRNVCIRFVLGDRPVNGGTMLNVVGCNGFNPGFGMTPPWTIGNDIVNRPNFGIYLNDIETAYTPYPRLPMMQTFKEALDLGVLEVPYQFNFSCKIG